MLTVFCTDIWIKPYTRNMRHGAFLYIGHILRPLFLKFILLSFISLLVYSETQAKASGLNYGIANAFLPNGDEKIIDVYTVWEGNQTIKTKDILTVNDTLIVNGNLTLGSGGVLNINEGAVCIINGSLDFGTDGLLNIYENALCIIYGDFNLNNKVNLSIGAHLIVGGDLTTTANSDKIVTNIDSTAAIYVLGEVDTAQIEGFNCPDPEYYVPYTSSTECTYGDIISLEDNENDTTGIYDLFVSGDGNRGVSPVYSELCSGGSVSISALEENADWYQWCDSLGNYISGENSSLFTATGPGEYFVKIVVDNTTTDTTISYRAKVVESSLVASISGNNSPLCNGDDAIFTVWGTNGATLVFNINGGEDSSIVLPESETTIIVSGVTADQTLNLISVSNGTVSCDLDESSTIIVNSLPSIYSAWINGGGVICKGGTANIGASANSDINWYAGSCSSGILVGTGTSLSVSPDTTTTYYARAYNSSTGCESLGCESVTITVNEPPTITLGTMPEINTKVSPAYIPYSSTTGNPTNYSIDFDADANAAGFQDHINYLFSEDALKVYIPDGGWGVTAGTYYGVLTVKTNTPVECESVGYPISVKIVDSDTEAGVSITVSDNIICQGEEVTFIATPTNGGSSPAYQWQVDGSNVSGATFSTFVSSSFTNGQEISCVMTSNLSGVTNNPATSNIITMIVDELPTITLVSNSADICLGENTSEFEYSVTGGTPVKYNVDFDIDSENEGFIDIVGSNLTPGIINIVVPADAATGVYYAILTVINESNCESMDYPISVTVHALPKTGNIIPE